MTESVEFIPGKKLAEMFFFEAVEPVLNELNPKLQYSAGLIGPGSEVLGFDSAVSSDHHWGPRVMLFLGEDDNSQLSGSMKTVLAHKLPHRFKGYPTSFTPGAALVRESDSESTVVQLLDYENTGMVSHRVEIDSLSNFLRGYIGIGLETAPAIADWLVIPEQKLRSLKDGSLFRDDLNLQSTLNQLDYYPDDLWLYLLASCWTRIEQSEHLMGRAGQVGDEIGSAIIAASIVRDLMRLCFLMDRVYAPYAKWFGSAFKKLPIDRFLRPHLESALCADSWQDRERCLVKAYKVVAERHNQLGITAMMPVEARSFHDRPFKVISMGDFSSSIKAVIKDEQVRRLMQTRLLGNVDLISDSTDISESLFAQGVFKQLFL